MVFFKDLDLFGITTAPFAGTLIAVIVSFLINEWFRYRSRIKGLPGPSGLPVIGNLHQIAGKPASEQYRLWSKKYGPVFQIQLGNTPAVIINSTAAAKTLFLSQGSVINSRPVFGFFHQKLGSAALSIGMSPWDESCKRKRKVAATALNRSKTVGYHPLLKYESRELMAALLDAGDAGKTAFIAEPVVHQFALNLSLALNYGTRASSAKAFKSSPLFQEAIFVEEAIGKLRSVGMNYANYIPALRLKESVSKALGLSSTQKQHSAKAIAQRRAEYNRIFLDELRQRVKDGTDSPCIQGGVLRDPESSALTETELLGISFSMMAGSETNSPTIGWALLLLSQRLDIQKLAFEEINSSGALSGDPLALEGEVPYIMAFTKEVLRYFTPLRLVMPKATTDAVEWQGATIPKGTMVFLNAWSCNREEGAFDDPFTFEPKRWLADNPHQHYSFGYGGRMCVAAHLANKALYTIFLHLVGNFEVLPGTEDGDIDIDPLSGIDNVNHQRSAPRWKKLRFVPRNLDRLKTALDS